MRSAATFASLVALAIFVIAPPARAQTPPVVYRRAVAEPGPFVFRLADVSRRWIVLERDRDLVSQEILVLDARDGHEVLRAPGLTLAVDVHRTVSESFDLALRPWLAGDRVVQFVDDHTLVALSLPDGRELWRAEVPAGAVFQAVQTSETRVVWCDGSSLHVLDAASGAELWRADVAAWASGAHVAIAADGRVAAWDAHGAVIVWDAAGHETTRVALPIDYSAATVVFSGPDVVSVGSRVTWIDPASGAVRASLACRQGCAAVDTPTHLVLLDADGARARAHDGSGTVALRRVPPTSWLLEASQGPVVVTEDGLASQYDLATGLPTLRVSVGRMRAVWLYRPRARVAVARGAGAGGEDLLVHVDASGALEVRTLSSTRASAPPTVVVTGVLLVNGRARERVPVQVAGRTVRTGAGGRFRVRLDVEGPLLFRVSREALMRAAHQPCASELEELVEAPTSPLHVRLVGQAYGYECDGACRCD